MAVKRVVKKKASVCTQLSSAEDALFDISAALWDQPITGVHGDIARVSRALQAARKKYCKAKYTLLD